MTPQEVDARTRLEHDCLTCSGVHAPDPVTGMGRGEWPACVCGWLSGPDCSLAQHLENTAEAAAPAPVAKMASHDDLDLLLMQGLHRGREEKRVLILELAEHYEQDGMTYTGAEVADELRRIAR